MATKRKTKRKTHNTEGVPYGHPIWSLRMSPEIGKLVDDETVRLGVSRRVFVEQLIRERFGLPTLAQAVTADVLLPLANAPTCDDVTD